MRHGETSDVKDLVRINVRLNAFLQRLSILLGALALIAFAGSCITLVTLVQQQAGGGA